MEKLLNKENTWDNATACENVEGPCELIRRDELLKALRMMKKGKAVDISMQFDSSSKENS